MVKRDVPSSARAYEYYLRGNQLSLDSKHTSVVHTWFLLKDYGPIADTRLEENPYIVALSLDALGRSAQAIGQLRHLDDKAPTRMRDFMIAARTMI
jgi:hypothetical protein